MVKLPSFFRSLLLVFLVKMALVPNPADIAGVICLTILNVVPAVLGFVRRQYDSPRITVLETQVSNLTKDLTTARNDISRMSMKVR